MRNRRIWRKRWKDDAVSPVIATILMVAITVVLAAVLYVVVTTILINPETKPNVSLSSGMRTKNAGEWKINVESVSWTEDIAEFKIAVLNGTDIAIEATSLTIVKESGASGGGLTITFKEPNSDDSLNAGDYFILSGTDQISDYTVEIHYKTQGKASVNGEIKQ